MSERAASTPVPAPADEGAADEARRKQVYAELFSGLGMLMMAGFAVKDFVLGDVPGFAVKLVVFLLLGLCLLWARTQAFSDAKARVGLGLLGGFLAYEYMVGASAGSVLMWLFLFPLVALFALGRREGSVWTAALWLMAVVLLLFPEALGVDPVPSAGFRLRFPLCLAVASIFAYGYERFREQAQARGDAEAERLQREHWDLEEAREELERAYLEVHESHQILEEEIEQRKRAEIEKQELIDDLLAAAAQVRRLHGLLPICSSCKKIRDDRGYWKQLEEYFHAHSDVVFSHGMCPECMVEFYPDDIAPGQLQK